MGIERFTSIYMPDRGILGRMNQDRLAYREELAMLEMTSQAGVSGPCPGTRFIAPFYLQGLTMFGTALARDLFSLYITRLPVSIGASQSHPI